ncbi:hypothetical protein I204_00709 [Kwoniella mangroviensis CBS 8886]|nr:hypothetical protein I204_00709 [Kwoniella mangroviensis CBS 8886]
MSVTVVTNGHFNVPHVPSIPGLRSYKGQILHSRWWRNPRVVRGKNIVIVGSHASGTDIARDIALDDEATDAQTRKNVRTIYQSAREKDKPRPNDEGEDQSLYPNTKWRDHVELVSEIERIDGDLVHLKGGRVLSDLDVILFATGYLYSYPFFSPDKAPFDSHPIIRSSTQEERSLSAGPANRPINLDETDTFYVPDRTLAFIGLHRLVNPLPLFERSAGLIAHCFINGSIPPLPPLKRDSDIPGDLNIGHPQEFENQDEWLKAIGDGDEWKVPQRLRDLRGNAIKIRKEHLGY